MCTTLFMVKKNAILLLSMLNYVGSTTSFWALIDYSGMQWELSILPKEAHCFHLILCPCLMTWLPHLLMSSSIPPVGWWIFQVSLWVRFECYSWLCKFLAKKLCKFSFFIWIRNDYISNCFYFPSVLYLNYSPSPCWLGTFKFLSKCIGGKGFSGTKRYFGDLGKSVCYKLCFIRYTCVHK